MDRFLIGPVSVHKRSRLPHWQCAYGIYAVTFNLFDAVPSERLRRMRVEAEVQRERLRRLRGRPSIAEESAISKVMDRELIRLLDEGHGCALLRSNDAAGAVAAALTRDDATRYELYAWCVMPNHVHVVCTLQEGERIASIVRRWKGASAREANRQLQREGQPFWQQDYFDRTVRSPTELRRWLSYVESNPVKAGLHDWPWVRVYRERVATYLV